MFGHDAQPLQPVFQNVGVLASRQPITYYENNRDHMRYDEYLSAGYPIASGVIEGACHHFVKDRMEGAGMRWELEGAQSMLSLRALYLNDQWDGFIAYRIAQEQQFLYGETQRSALCKNDLAIHRSQSLS